MKKLIISALVLTLGFAGVVRNAPRTHVREGLASANHASDTHTAPALESPVNGTDRDVEAFDAIRGYSAPEITIVGVVPVVVRHVETDSEHVARLMAAPVRCTEMGDLAWSTESNAAGQVGGNGRVASCL